MDETNWRSETVAVGGTRLRLSEAGNGNAVLCLRSGGDAPPRAEALIAAHRQVLSLAPAAATTAADLDRLLAARGIERYDIVAYGERAALALELARLAGTRAQALVLLGPTVLGADGAPHRTEDEAVAQRLGEVATPTLCLFGTKDATVPVGAARHYRERMPDCNLFFVYDAGQAMADERPEAVASIMREFLERHDQFLVLRESGMIFP